MTDDLNRLLKTKAMRQNKSLSAYLRPEIERIAQLPTLQEMTTILLKQQPVKISTQEIVDAIHAGREENDAKLARTTPRRNVIPR